MLRSILALSLIIFLLGCSTNKKTNADSEKSQSDPTATESKVSLSKAPDSPQFPEASLKKTTQLIQDRDSVFAVDYSFEVENYELGVQTSDADSRGIANSGKGQHIHFIVNNGPYSAHYMPGVSNALDEGSYTVLAFLSRSYHESVKEPGAFHVENLVVGDAELNPVDLQAPHLFYSRPKGTYAGEDTDRVMLDFYLLNCDLSPDGYKVKATINGEEFLIDEWAPYFIEGLPTGDNAIKLELLDKEGNLVASPFNPVKRLVTLTD